MQTMPHTGSLPITQPAPTGHAAAISQFRRQILPRDTGSQHIDNAVEGVLIIDTRPSTFGRTLYLRNQ